MGRKRSGRNSRRPTNQRYWAERRDEKHKATRARRLTRHLEYAALRRAEIIEQRRRNRGRGV